MRMLVANPSLDHLRPLLSPACFAVDGYIGLGVPIGTDAFIQHFVKDKCQTIMDDVDKIDNIQDGFIHYQLLRFCQATRLHLDCCFVFLWHVKLALLRETRACVALTQVLEGRPMFGELLRDTLLGRDDGLRGLLGLLVLRAGVNEGDTCLSLNAK